MFTRSQASNTKRPDYREVNEDGYPIAAILEAKKNLRQFLKDSDREYDNDSDIVIDMRYLLKNLISGVSLNYRRRVVECIFRILIVYKPNVLLRNTAFRKVLRDKITQFRKEYGPTNYIKLLMNIITDILDNTESNRSVLVEYSNDD
jgi:hypothetical protein